MLTRQIAPPENNQKQNLFPCSRCGKYSQSAIMCEACFDETDPSLKQDGGVWYELHNHKTPKGRAYERKQRTAQVSQSATFTDLATARYLAAQAKQYAPGWTERWEAFSAHEAQIKERQEWLKTNAPQMWAVTAWLWWEEETDRVRLSRYKWDELSGKSSIRTKNIDISDVNEKNIDQHNQLYEMNDSDYEVYFPEEDQSITPYQRNLYSRYTVFAKKVVELLNNEEFAILQVLVYQVKRNRAARNNRTCKAEDAAKTLTVHLGRRITPANYRKLTQKLRETLEVEDGLHLDMWIESGIL